MNYISITLSIVIFIIILLQIYNPFLSSNAKELNTRFKTYITNIFEKQQAEKEILDIEEQSLIDINNKQGGIDDVNASTNTSDANALTRRQLVFQSSTLGKSVLNDTFQNNEPNTLTLKLLYKPGCVYSAQFMPMWHEIKNSLPNNVITEELNCDRVDILGNSICSNYNISGVPSLILMVPDSDIPVIFKHNRTYQNIKLWLKQNGIQLSYNPEVEHFDKTGGYVDTEQFNNTTSTSSKGHSTSGLVGKVISAEGNIRAPYDALYRAESRVNEHDEYHDVDEDGCPIASFSICKENSVNPGYQIFTHRGQWGCVYPDPNTSINNGFDAAFSTVDHYLHSLPPKMEQVVDDKGHVHLKEVPYTADEKIEQMKKCAIKYSKNIRNFGLCDAGKLNDKYTIKNKIEAGEASLPFDGMNVNEYNDTMQTAEALYTTCSL